MKGGAGAPPDGLLRGGRTTAVLATALVTLLGACASAPQVKVVQNLAPTAGAPYQKVLVVALFEKFDFRRYLEEEIVSSLAAQGVTAVRSTSRMDTRTPVVAQTFIDMVQEIGADALLLTQMTGHAGEVSAKDARPEATLNYWPTYYYNVFEVQQTEYIAPPIMQVSHDLVLGTQMFSVRDRKPVWAMESHSQFVVKIEDGLDYGIFVQEAEAIVRQLVRDGVVQSR